MNVKNNIVLSKFKGFTRNILNIVRKKVFKDARKQKIMSVKFHNFFSRKCSAYDADIFDYKEILKGSSNFYSSEYYRGNTFFGIANVLRDYSGYKKPINACIEHGVYFGDYINTEEAVNSGLNAIITFGPKRLEHLDGKTDVPAIAIGPYLSYAKPVLTEEEIIDLKKKHGKTLVVFPSHSIDRVRAEYDMESFIEEIKRISINYEYKKVIVCLFYSDIKYGREKKYLENGFTVVTAGYRCDPLFLNRLKTYILLSDCTMSNNIGTHIGYCVSLVKPHYVYSQQVKYEAVTKSDMHNVTISYNTKLEFEKNEVISAFSKYVETITKEQLEIVDKYWGSSNVRKPQELYDIFVNIED